MLVKRAQMFPVECVVRGYLSGSGWKEYKANGSVCGIKLPAGLRESDQLPEPIFTPATKATTGHDENISFEHMTQLVDPEDARQLRDLSLEIYSKAADLRPAKRDYHCGYEIRVRAHRRRHHPRRRSADSRLLPLLAG